MYNTFVLLSCLTVFCESAPSIRNVRRIGSRTSSACEAVDVSNPISAVLSNLTVTIGGGTPLRILPLGDSITFGYRSSDGNGYRWRLEQDLSRGNRVNMIGSVSSGTMCDNQNEGHNGAVISEIATYANYSLPMRPNVVLVHAGTNDMNQPDDPDSAPARLGSLIDQIVAACPDAAVLVAKIIPAANPTTMARINTYNKAVPGVVAKRARAGKTVMVVDFSHALTTKELVDGLHPTDEGYRKMGNVWYRGIQKAGLKGWIKPPVEGTKSPN
ncbi:CAZyme family CE3 [Paecilomyces variotii]|nr:CAZyme family CE3 [Paecilomyces variotii]KAJ9393030.1 CAZyme family CE3 [Paecilomyces variotii]